MKGFPGLLVHAAALALAAMVLVAAGQPLFTDDAWWYLSMGEAYLEHGPWLEADPLLHTAAGPPAPAAWLFAVALSSIERVAGFTGLRVAHVILVGLALGLAWSSLRRVSGERVYASLGMALFAALSAYRLFQLRPQLISMCAALILVWLLIEPRSGPSRRRIAAAVLLCGVWANLHAAFVLAPLLLGAGVAGILLASVMRRQGLAASAPRLRRLVVALALVLLATLANPEGIAPHLLYFAAGAETPELALVADEWAPFGLLRMPVPNLPPSPLGWGLVWALLALSAAVVAGECFAWLRRGAREQPGLDPALVGVAVVSLVALVSAVRFTWLGIFPLLLLGQHLRARAATRPAPRPGIGWAVAIGALVLVAAFARFGSWPMISRGVQLASYASPYSPVKYYAHAVWFLRDAALEGNLFNDYSRGNFLGYWLAPRMRVFVNGSLNLPKDAMDASLAIARRGWQSDDALVDLLDRYSVDVFFGTGLPEARRPGRPEISTTTHLDGTPGWVPAFRNIRSAVFVRARPQDRGNLERIAAYYAREGVPFDAARGFDVGRVIREAPAWAHEHALIPVHFERLRSTSRSGDPNRRRSARAQLASIYLALGLYDEAEALDRQQLATRPPPVAAARRLLWSLLQRGRAGEALEAADRLAALAAGAPESDSLSGVLVNSARRYPEISVQDARALAAATPVFSQREAWRLLAGYREAEPRLQQH